VLTCPNTLRAETLFKSLMAAHAANGRVMDVGCGSGALSRELHDLGARDVYSFDLSRRAVEQARATHGSIPGLTFAVHGIEDPIDGQFDLIVGRSILHHVDFRTALQMLVERNLAPGGRILFMEPLSHPLTLLFHRLVRSAHSPDEWPLTPDDLQWLKNRFGAHVRPINFVSFPLGAISSLLLPTGDNALMRAADRIDRSLERRPRLAARGRQGILVMDRPGPDGRLEPNALDQAA
jgi:SAM-dependent methyltransferase